MNVNIDLRARVLALGCAVSVIGCANVSGLDAGDKFACSAPAGVPCMSVSGVYANYRANTLPGMQTAAPGVAAAIAPPQKGSAGERPAIPSAAPTPMPAPTLVAKSSPALMSAPNSGTPLRVPERILRVWMAPFEDTDGDLHDQKYFYVTVAPGHWTIEAVRVNVKPPYSRITPLSRANPANTSSRESIAGTPQQAAQQVLQAQQGQSQPASAVEPESPGEQ